MSLKQPEGPEALIAPLYVVAFLLVATPVMDFATSIIPARPSDIEWRFASVGLLSGFLLTPLLGIALAMGVARFAGHVRTQRIMALLNLAVTVLFVALLLFFLLDIFQLRSAVQPEAAEAFASAATKAVIKHGSFIVTLGVMGWSGFRMSRWSVPEPRRKQSALIVGS
jgi:chromate transport protein ChrA